MIPGLFFLICVIVFLGVGAYILVRWLCKYIARNG